MKYELNTTIYETSNLIKYELRRHLRKYYLKLPGHTHLTPENPLSMRKNEWVRQAGDFSLVSSKVRCWVRILFSWKVFRAVEFLLYSGTCLEASMHLPSFERNHVSIQISVGLTFSTREISITAFAISTFFSREISLFSSKNLIGTQLCLRACIHSLLLRPISLPFSEAARKSTSCRSRRFALSREKYSQRW